MDEWLENKVRQEHADMQAEYERLLEAVPQGTTVSDHVRHLYKKGRPASNEHYVELMTVWAMQLTERELVNLVDGGPYNFGGRVEKVRLDPASHKVEIVHQENLRKVVVYID